MFSLPDWPQVEADCLAVGGIWQDACYMTFQTASADSVTYRQGIISILDSLVNPAILIPLFVMPFVLFSINRILRV